MMEAHVEDLCEVKKKKDASQGPPIPTIPGSPEHQHKVKRLSRSKETPLPT